MRYLLVLLLSMVIVCPASAAASVDPVSSRVSADKTQLSADGISNALITVTVKDTNLAAMQGKKVILASSRGTQDEIRIESDMTDVLGKAYFRVFSLRDGTAIFSAMIDGVRLDRTATITYAGGLSAGLQPGDLIKIPDDGNVNTLNDTAGVLLRPERQTLRIPQRKNLFHVVPEFFQGEDSFD